MSYRYEKMIHTSVKTHITSLTSRCRRKQKSYKFPSYNYAYGIYFFFETKTNKNYGELRAVTENIGIALFIILITTYELLLWLLAKINDFCTHSSRDISLHKCNNVSGTKSFVDEATFSCQRLCGIATFKSTFSFTKSHLANLNVNSLKP